MNLFAKLFAPVRPADPPDESQPRFRIVGSVWRDGPGLKLLNRTDAVRPGESARALKDEWESDMRAAFPDGTVFNCVVREARTNLRSSIPASESGEWI